LPITTHTLSGLAVSTHLPGGADQVIDTPYNAFFSLRDARDTRADEDDEAVFGGGSAAAALEPLTAYWPATVWDADWQGGYIDGGAGGYESSGEWYRQDQNSAAAAAAAGHTNQGVYDQQANMGLQPFYQSSSSNGEFWLQGSLQQQQQGPAQEPAATQPTATSAWQLPAAAAPDAWMPPEHVPPQGAGAISEQHSLALSDGFSHDLPAAEASHAATVPPALEVLGWDDSPLLPAADVMDRRGTPGCCWACGAVQHTHVCGGAVGGALCWRGGIAASTRRWLGRGRGRGRAVAVHF
jgi:hypothetical protein